jgi:hypothetical protein
MVIISHCKERVSCVVGIHSWQISRADYSETDCAGLARRGIGELLTHGSVKLVFLNVAFLIMHQAHLLFFKSFNLCIEVIFKLLKGEGLGKVFGGDWLVKK